MEKMTRVRSRRSRRILIALVAVTAVAMAFVAAAPPVAYDGAPAFVANPVEQVDTLVGTGTGGETVGEINDFPGAAVPFGMVQYSPDTLGNYAGYNYDNSRATGFSMTHASVGCSAFGDISILPTTTPLGARPWNAWERISHDDTEQGMPGYYTVRFPGTRVTAELTATTRTGVGRFSFPRDGRPALFHVRSGASLAGNSRAAIQIGEDNTMITGSATSGGFCGKNNTYTVYFAMKFSRPFTSFGAWDGYAVYAGARNLASPYAGGYVEFPAGSVIEVHTAISYVSVEGAQANLAAEGGANFDSVRAAALSEWNAALSRISVAGRKKDDLRTFYSSLYHSLLHPNTFNDADGRYIGFDGRIRTVAHGRTQYTNFSDWDTYRCLAALQALLFPKQASDMAQSLVNDAEQSGSFPRWALANSATGEMSGDSVVPLIVSFYAFGAKDFDVKTALRYMVSGATNGGVGRDGYVERPGISTYLELGYLPEGPGFGPSASITLEWSIDDFAISRFADALGDSATAAQFQNRGQYWQNLFNPTTRYISPRNLAGFFRAGPAFYESPLTFSQPGFDEGNAEQYVWWVPHNVAGLVTGLGGRAAAADRLDRFTKELNTGPQEPYLWAGNEPGFGVPWLYNYIGQPWKTQLTVDKVRGLFGPEPDGEPGNDDLGAMSSWYVWAALGMYPSTPGTPILTVGAPVFDRVIMALPGGKSINLSAPGASGPHNLKYVDGLSIDGIATSHTSLPESTIQSGANLAFSLSPHPNEAWGSAESSAPPSFGAGGSALTVNIVHPGLITAPGTTATVNVDAARMTGGVDGYTISAESLTSDVTAAPVSGKFASDGSATVGVTVTARHAAPEGYYPIYLTAIAGGSVRRLIVMVDVEAEDS
jgi:predicted alpha-1,2-mannosidase